MTTTAQGIREKVNTARSRAIITHRLDVKRVPFDCDRCAHKIRCASLSPGRAVVCELDDDTAMIALPEPGLADYEKCVEENAEYYLRVHFLGIE